MKSLLLNCFALRNPDINGPIKFKVQTPRTAKLILGSQAAFVEMHPDHFLKHKNKINSAVIVWFKRKTYLNRWIHNHWEWDFYVQGRDQGIDKLYMIKILHLNFLLSPIQISIFLSSFKSTNSGIQSPVKSTNVFQCGWWNGFFEKSYELYAMAFHFITRLN